jgi:filamentous hemagglutinin family protein
MTHPTAMVNSLKFFTLLLLLEYPLAALAQTQIKPDGTLPSNVNFTVGGVYEITGGTRPNNAANLFHSFKDFSLELGDTARFVHQPGVENVITRITGGSPSLINGTIGTLIQGSTDRGRANLFMINPKGIIFGENAKLDIGGSFVGSTADSIKFADGTEFSANPTANPILTISIPVGLQYGSNPDSTIRVNGPGNGLIFNQDNSLDRTNRPDGLHYENPRGQTLALVGGNVVMDGGNISLPEGRVELWSVKNGQVLLGNSNGKLKLQPGQGINYGNIELGNAASVDISGSNPGIIQVRGENIALKDGSVMVADTLNNGSAGQLNIQASESLIIKGIVDRPNNQVYSGLFADVAPGAIGGGSNIVIETKTLQLFEGGQISNGTFGQGNAGELKIRAKDIQLSGISPAGPSGIFAAVALGAKGKGGNLIIETENLRVANGAQLYTTTFGFGNAGELKIKAENIEVIGATKFGPSLLGSTVVKIPQIPEAIATFIGSGFGNGGNLFIETGSLQVVDGGQIASSTSGSGNAGNLQIQAKLVELASFFKATDQGGRSGLFANAIQENGNGGNIRLTTNQLTVRDGATISVSNFQSQNRGRPGQGAAGNIEINSPVILVNNQGSITADTNAGNQGNVVVRSQNLQMRQGSKISTNARNSSDGGNITITTDTLAALENSDITANAQKGFGGKVIVNAKGIFGTEFRPQVTSESDITASSDFGTEFNGDVIINTSDVDPSNGLVKLPADFSDRTRQIASGCAATQQNRFVISGKGGLPENPTQTLRVQKIWQDIRNLSVLGFSSTQVNSAETTNKNQQLLEAQGLVIANGKAQLVAEISQFNIDSLQNLSKSFLVGQRCHL